MCDPIIVNPVVKVRPHPAAHPHYPLLRKYPPGYLAANDSFLLVLKEWEKKAEFAARRSSGKSLVLYMNYRCTNLMRASK